jgi:hypothetical protein
MVFNYNALNYKGHQPIARLVAFMFYLYAYTYCSALTSSATSVS